MIMMMRRMVKHQQSYGYVKDCVRGVLHAVDVRRYPALARIDPSVFVVVQRQLRSLVLATTVQSLAAPYLELLLLLLLLLLFLCVFHYYPAQLMFRSPQRPPPPPRRRLRSEESRGGSDEFLRTLISRVGRSMGSYSV